MNNTFNLQRFLWLFDKHTKEHYKTYLMSVVVLIGILSITMGYAAYVGWFGSGPQSGFFFTFLLLTGSIFTSMIFADLGDKRKAISVLTLPVSHFERFMVGWIYSFIIFQLVFVACFFAVDFFIISFGRLSSHYKMLDLISEDGNPYAIFIYFWFLHAISFAGAVFFKKLHFIKTAFIFFAIIIAITLLNNLLVHLIFNGRLQNSRSYPFGSIFFYENGDPFYLESLDSVPMILTFSILVISICIWAAAFFKMKEKQV